MDASQTNDRLSSATQQLLIPASAEEETRTYRRTISNVNDELWRFRIGLLWLGLQRLTLKNFVLSWILFILCGLVVPLLSILYVDCRLCNESQRHPFDKTVQISESALCAIGFMCLWSFIRTFGLRKTLLLDQIDHESAEVQQGYHRQLEAAFRLLMKVLLPCFAVELVHKILWFFEAEVQFPFFPKGPLNNIIMCILVMISWLYRATCFLIMCVLFRLTCCLQILRLKAYYKLLESSFNQYSLIVKEHMRIRAQLVIMSHRFRIFLISSLLTITLSQIASLFIITTHTGAVSFPKVGDLAVCTATQLIGVIFCLHGAAKITHAAQRIVSFVSRVHAIATCIHSASSAPSTSHMNSSNGVCTPSNSALQQPENDIEDAKATLCSITDSNFVHSYCKRSALVDYFHHCRGSITIYGFVVDRGSIYGIFALELSLTLWTLGKTLFVHT